MNMNKAYMHISPILKCCKVSYVLHVSHSIFKHYASTYACIHEIYSTSIMLNMLVSLEPCCVGLLTMRPLEASSGRVMVAGVVRRLRARVSCSITASISCRDTRKQNQHPTQPLNTQTRVHFLFIYVSLSNST